MVILITVITAIAAYKRVLSLKEALRNNDPSRVKAEAFFLTLVIAVGITLIMVK
ncbi:MAG: hypothetical protein IM571_07545 [Chitinophagaceae bacterium]|nr:hypothetical protein [Chitinophagaceae bacterium]MCA6477796.1 hypothetical protein [Chitinophagaceae bacterium]